LPVVAAVGVAGAAVGFGGRGLGVVAVVAGVAVLRHARRTAAGDGIDVAIVADLLSAALGAGATTSAAVHAAATAVEPGAARALRALASDLRAGDDPDAVWARAVAAAPDLADVARTCTRAAASGAAVADELHDLAARERSSRKARARWRLQRRAVWMVLPTGLCFLPAFVLVGVVPLVVSAVPASAR
jgi:Flp pilus assembly protein TadB